MIIKRPNKEAISAWAGVKAAGVLNPRCQPATHQRRQLGLGFP